MIVIVVYENCLSSTDYQSVLGGQFFVCWEVELLSLG